MLCRLTVLFSGQTFSPKSSLTTNILNRLAEKDDLIDNLDLDCDDIIIDI